MSRSARRRRYSHTHRDSIDYYFDCWRTGSRLAKGLRLKKLSRRGTCARYRLVGYPKILNLVTSDHGLSVFVVWESRKRKTLWDFIVSLDAGYRRVSDGLVCTCCDRDEEKVVYPDLAALYTEHLFDPFLEWFRNRLVLSTHLCLGVIQGATWARPVDLGKDTVSSDETVIRLLAE